MKLIKDKSKNYKSNIFALIIFILGIYTGILVFDKLIDTSDNVIIYETNVQKDNLFLKSPQKVKINLPAVDRNDSGVTAFLEVEIRQGTGLILVNVDNIITNFDTQESMRSSANIASDYTNKSLDNLDIIYNLVANASILEGPSAGAAITIATILALENNTINDKVMITGTINHDFTIGPAGRIKSKAIAVEKSGASFFLVPVGESYEYVEKEHCSDYGIFENYCQTEFVPVKIDEFMNMSVIEVHTLDDALDIFRVL